MPEFTEAELTALESKTETVRLLRLQKEEENAALDLELSSAKAQLADIQRNKGDFESKVRLAVEHSLLINEFGSSSPVVDKFFR